MKHTHNLYFDATSIKCRECDIVILPAEILSFIDSYLREMWFTPTEICGDGPHAAFQEEGDNYCPVCGLCLVKE